MRPGDSFEVTCTSTVPNPFVIQWRLSNSGEEPFEIVLFSIYTLPKTKDKIGPFLLTLVSVDPLTSTANLSSVGNDLYGTVLTCSSTLSLYPTPNETSHIAIHIEGKYLILLTGLYVYHNRHIYVDRHFYKEQILVHIFLYFLVHNVLMTFLAVRRSFCEICFMKYTC